MSERCRKDRYRRPLALILVALISLTHASAFPAQTSIAVVPVADGDRDKESRDLAKEFVSSLQIVTPHHIVDSNLTANVLDYHGDDAAKTNITPELKAAEDAVVKAKEDFFAFKYRESEDGLNKAIFILEGGCSKLPETCPVLVDAYVSRAVVVKSKGDVVGAKRSLSSALRINPKLNLVIEEYPPSLISIFEESKMELTRRPTGSIRIETKPESVEIYLNGIGQGVSPLEIGNLPAGFYQLEIKANKYKPVTKNIDIKENEHVSINEKLAWESESKAAEKSAMTDAASQIREGLRIADLMKTDKVILIDVDAGEGSKNNVVARMVDARLKAGQPAFAIVLDEEDEYRIKGLAKMTYALSAQSNIDIMTDPNKNIDPLGMGDPAILGKRKRKLHKNPWFWGVLGTLAAGAATGGILAAMSSGSSGNTGSVKVGFK